MKKTILFFSRAELTYLYGSLHDFLIKYYNIVHVAYSIDEEAILRSKFGINEIFVFKEIYKEHWRDADQNKAITLDLIDQLLISQTEGRFNLNSALQSDRSFQSMDLNTSLKITLTYYRVWSRLFTNRKIDLFIHEPCSLMINHLACVICKKQGGIYQTWITVQGENPNLFMAVDHDNGVSLELNMRYMSVSEEDDLLSNTRVKNFLIKFRNSYQGPFQNIDTGRITIPYIISLFKSILRNQYDIIKNKRKYKKVYDNIELFLLQNQLYFRQLINIFKYRSIRYDAFDPTQEYYFYPLHVEPEAVVLYWGDGIYKNQVKLIENVAGQLPPGVQLYVKDHPWLYGYRDPVDYDRISQIPNVKLLPSYISGKQIIKDSLGVVTINGTAGFEALLLNKHVFTFGSCFYNTCKRVKHIANIKDFRSAVYQSYQSTLKDDPELYRFILAYLQTHKNGFVEFYSNNHVSRGIDLKTNAQQISEVLVDQLHSAYSPFKQN